MRRPSVQPVRRRPSGAGALAISLLALFLNVTGVRAAEPAESEATRRAIEFLAAEVPGWPRRNNCFSCHNNGDGARALFAARQRGWEVPEDATAGTIRWLLQPDRWEQDGGNPDYGDRTLITVQFSAALAALGDVAVADGDDTARDALRAAATTLAELQSDDGSWAFEAEGQIGSPIGYGRSLMTVIARDVLSRAESDAFAIRIDRANQWLRSAKPRTVLDAAAVLWGLAKSGDPDVAVRRRALLASIRRGQSPRGGWGPYAISAPEPFDTAVVLLALSQLEQTDEVREMIADGRAFLEKTQLPSGAWPATTRPPGVESYPQQLSTTAWATLALISTQ